MQFEFFFFHFDIDELLFDFTSISLSSLLISSVAELSFSNSIL